MKKNVNTAYTRDSYIRCFLVMTEIQLKLALSRKELLAQITENGWVNQKGKL